MNADSREARRTHDATKHSVASVRRSSHGLAWDIQPMPYKIYETLPPIALPREWTPADTPALDAIAGGAERTRARAVPDLPALARLLHLSAGIVRKAVYPDGQERYFRAAACTGALYHVDLYVVCGPLAGLTAGVYHFGPHDFALRRLRDGDYREAVIAASAAEPAVASAPVVVVAASTFWRNAWKYQARAYRHCFWDGGTLLANLLAVAAAAGLPARVVLGFADLPVRELLGLEPEREAALALVALGHDPDRTPAPAPPRAPLVLPTVPLSTREVDYPEIGAAFAASSLSTAEVRAWRDAPTPAPLPATTGGQTVALHPVATVPVESIDAVIRRRGSTRRFAPAAITLEQLSTILARATGAIPMDCLAPAGVHLGQLYLIVHAVDGVEAGAYVLRPDGAALERLRAGDFRREAGALGLGQELPADASVNVYVLTDLEAVLARYGNRGYRAAQLDAAIVGGRIYLAAYALGLGATGLTFFDDDVTAFFSPHAAGKSVMFLTAVGRAGVAVRSRAG